MKNAIKVSTILGIVAFFIPAYSMEESALADDCSSQSYKVALSKMRGIDLFLNMNRLTIFCHDSTSKVEPLPKGHPIFTNEDLPFTLSLIQALEDSDIKKGSKSLKKISNAVLRGGSLCPKHDFVLEDNNWLVIKAKISIQPDPSGKNLISVFSIMNNWIEKTKSSVTGDFWNTPAAILNKTRIRETARKLVFNTIFEAADRRKFYVDNELKSGINSTFDIDASQMIINLFFSFLDNEKNRIAIEQAKK